jgi:hypothetical protein
MGHYNGLISAEYNPPKNWILKKPLSYSNTEIDSDLLELMDIRAKFKKITAPRNFKTDLVSVPRFCWAIISPWDIARAAVIHDYLYSKIKNRKETTSPSMLRAIRKAADKVFLLAMKDTEPKVPDWKIYIAYYAVRIFGFMAIK